jgi:hypothetical protein
MFNFLYIPSYSCVIQSGLHYLMFVRHNIVYVSDLFSFVKCGNNESDYHLLLLFCILYIPGF